MMQAGNNRRCFAHSRVMAASILLLMLFLLAACDSTANTQEHPVPNQGKSLLYISTSTQSSPDTLTMLRSSDGRQLWQYHMHGYLAAGLAMPEEAIQQGATLKVVNGVVYFAVAAPSTLNPTSYTVMALRADNGTVVWQKQVKIGFFQPLVMADGEICVLEGSGTNGISSSSLSLYAYSMETGTLDWQRKWSDVSDHSNVPEYAVYMDGAFYFLDFFSLSVLQARTGHLLWKYEPSLRAIPSASVPVTAAHGIVTIYTLAGSIFQATGIRASLAGLRESDGYQVWSHAIDPILDNNSLLPMNLPIENGILYYATTNIVTDAITAYAMRLSDGAFLWQQSVTRQASALLNITVADGRFYALVEAMVGQGRFVSYPDSSVIVLQASNGRQLWHFQVNQEGFSQLAVSGGSSVYLHKNRALYVLRPGDGALLNQYQLPSDMPSQPTMLMATGKLSFTYQFSSSPDKTRVFVLQQDNGTMAWNQEFDVYVYGVVLGP